MADGRFSSGSQGSSPRSSLSRARFGRRSAGRAHLALGLGAGVAGASGNLGAWQALRAHLPGDVPTYAAATPGCGAPELAGPLCRYPIGAQRQKEALSPHRPGQAICRLPSPTLAPLQRAGQARPPTSGAQAGRRSRAVRAAQLPGPAPRKASGASAPELRTGIPGSRKQRKEGREDEALIAAEEEPGVWGHLLAGRTERTARAGPGTVQKAAGRIPSSSRRPGEARGGGVRGDNDLIVT